MTNTDRLLLFARIAGGAAWTVYCLAIVVAYHVGGLTALQFLALAALPFVSFVINTMYARKG